MLLFLALACHAPTPAGESGTAGDPLASPWSGTITLDSDYVVAAGETLVIRPGTWVKAAAGVTITVDGELDAAGTDDEAGRISFESADPPSDPSDTTPVADPWGGIVFNADAVSATFDRVDTYASGSIVEHARIAYATRGMHILGSSPYVHSVEFFDNVIAATTDTIGGAGLLISAGATPRIRDCVFQNNVANTFAYGGGAYIDQADPILQDDEFASNSASYGGGLSTFLSASPIVGGTFSANTSQSDGGGISLVSSVSALLYLEFYENGAKGDGAGVHVCVDCNPHASPYLYDDVIEANTSAATSPDGGAAGIGAAFLGGFDHNDVYGNLRGTAPSDFSWFNLTADAFPSWIANPVLDGDYWGTTDATAIADTLYDGADNATYSTVTVTNPAATSIATAPVARAVIASRQLEYTNAGDDVPVFLTVYNPGPEQIVTLSITENGAPATLDLAYPGAARSGDGWTLDLPENSVWFGTIADSTYDGTTTADTTWTATLTGSDGSVIGEPLSARYLYSPH